MRVKECLIFILNGPSASGKTMVMEHLTQQKEHNLERFITTTTRKPRLKPVPETNGKDYYFVSREEFEKSKNLIIEKTEYPIGSGVYYGTLHSEVKRINAMNKDAIVVLDINGVKAFKRVYGSERVVSIFIYRDLGQIEKDLLKRNLPKEEVKRRMELAKKELLNISLSDHVVYNIKDKEALINDVLEIIEEERKRRANE